MQLATWLVFLTRRHKKSAPTPHVRQTLYPTRLPGLGRRVGGSSSDGVSRLLNLQPLLYIYVRGHTHGKQGVGAAVVCHVKICTSKVQICRECKFAHARVNFFTSANSHPRVQIFTVECKFAYPPEPRCYHLEFEAVCSTGFTDYSPCRRHRW